MGDFDNVAGLDLQARGRGGGDEGGIAPDELGERARQLLEPGIVGEAAIPQSRVGLEGEGHGAVLNRTSGGWRNRVDRLCPGAGNDARLTERKSGVEGKGGSVRVEL